MGAGLIRHMRRQPRWALASAVPIVFGVVWLVTGWDHGFIAGLFASVPGVVLCGAGAALLLWPGARLANCYLALFSAGSVVLAIVMAWVLGFGIALLLIMGGLLCGLLAGRLALSQDEVPADVPATRLNWAMSAKAALDEGFMAFFVACSSIPRGDDVTRGREELEQIEAFAARHDWANKPDSLHCRPDAPEGASIARDMWHGRAFDWLSFDSNYQPPEGVPGTTRWLDQKANRRVYARVFAHTDERVRPWLVCLHGYRMGTAVADFSLFDVNYLHQKLGLNVIMPILPLHGRRRQARLSGGGFLDGHLVNAFHAEVQALWDIRRCLAWLRTEHNAENIGVLGYSLGGYNAALLAAFEPKLACVIAGIPLTDIPRTLWRNMPIVDRRYMEAAGLSSDWISDVMAPVSPLRLRPRVPQDRRYIFAAVGDQVVPPYQPHALWQFWGEPTMHWYQGTHLSVRRERSVVDFIDRALEETILSEAASHATVGSGLAK